MEAGGLAADLGDLLLDALAADRNADAGRRRRDLRRQPRRSSCRRGRRAAGRCGAAVGAPERAACGACAAAGVSPAAARAIAHPISFIRTPVTWVGTGTLAARAPELGGLIGAAFRSLKRQFRRIAASVEARLARSLFSAAPTAVERWHDRRRNPRRIPRRRSAARRPFHPVLGPAQPALPAMRAGADGPGAGRAAGPGARRQAARRGARRDRRRRLAGDGRGHHRP